MNEEDGKTGDQAHEKAYVRTCLGTQSIVLVGVMGAGKTTIGRKLAQALDLPFVDSDQEIESAAGSTISDIFAEYGEDFFRSGERKVIARLLGQGPQVLSTGGGAFMTPETRDLIGKSGVSIWLKTPLPLLVKRLKNKKSRPLLHDRNLVDVLHRLMEERYPVYAQAALTIDGGERPLHIVAAMITALQAHFSGRDGKG